MTNRPTLFAVALSLVLSIPTANVGSSEPTSFRLMTFNIWHGGVKGGQPLSQTVDVMKFADVVGIQETHIDEIDNSIEIAKQLGWYHFQQGDRTAVVSRYRINAQC